MKQDKRDENQEWKKKKQEYIESERGGRGEGEGERRREKETADWNGISLTGEIVSKNLLNRPPRARARV